MGTLNHCWKGVQVFCWVFRTGRQVTLPGLREDNQTVAFRGSRSRNKVSVGEPAEGSFVLFVSVGFRANANTLPCEGMAFCLLRAMGCAGVVDNCTCTAVIESTMRWRCWRLHCACHLHQ